MEEEGPIDFRALRARFQEEALLAQSRTGRPAVAEKPKHLPAPGGPCSSAAGGTNVAAESTAPPVPRPLVRDGLRASGGRRPISFPPHPQPTPSSSPPASGDGVTKQSLKDRRLPLVLPVPPPKTEQSARKEHKPEPARPQTLVKKKALPLPIPAAKAPKVVVENRRETTYADLLIRPSSAPGDLPSMSRNDDGDGNSFQADQSTPSSPDAPVSPPSASLSFDSTSKIQNTLEKAKKKFSCKQMLVSTKPKGVRSPDRHPRDKTIRSSPKKAGTVKPLPLPPPAGFPHLAHISARTFSKAKRSSRKAALGKRTGKEKTPPHSAPPKRPLPNLKVLGPAPPKPPRPPSVDLDYYRQLAEVSPGSSGAASEESEPASLALDAPDFPDFETPEMETAESESLYMCSLDLEGFGLAHGALPEPVPWTGTDSEDPPRDSPPYEPVEPFMSQDPIPDNSPGRPEPVTVSEFPGPAGAESWYQNTTVSPGPVPDYEDADLAAQEVHYVDPDVGIQPQASGHEGEALYESYDDLYEDVVVAVKNTDKAVGDQASRKHKVGPKVSFPPNLPAREEASLNIWPRNPWTASGEQAHSSHMLFPSKERQSPSSADQKEQKKREKQRLEKEKKEQKEREKKENEMKKKFKITGNEEPLYNAKVMVASKGRKNYLPVNIGDTVSIIRTTNCPRGKWLARDADHKYGYISVMSVELSIKDVVELGKKAQAAGRAGGNPEGDSISLGSRSSSHPMLTSSFTDDSEEWDCEDETLSPSEFSSFSQPTASAPETSCGLAGAQHPPSYVNVQELQAQHQALQKLAVFFQQGKSDGDDVTNAAAAATPTNDEPADVGAGEEPLYLEPDADIAEEELIPPPPLYADPPP